MHATLALKAALGEPQERFRGFYANSACFHLLLLHNISNWNKIVVKSYRIVITA